MLNDAMEYMLGMSMGELVFTLYGVIMLLGAVYGVAERWFAMFMNVAGAGIALAFIHLGAEQAKALAEGKMVFSAPGTPTEPSAIILIAVVTLGSIIAAAMYEFRMRNVLPLAILIVMAAGVLCLAVEVSWVLYPATSSVWLHGVTRGMLLATLLAAPSCVLIVGIVRGLQKVLAQRHQRRELKHLESSL